MSQSVESEVSKLLENLPEGIAKAIRESEEGLPESIGEEFEEEEELPYPYNLEGAQTSEW